MSDYSEKIDAILNWARSKPNFDTEFVESVENQLNERGDLTSAQEEALDNIIEKFRIKV